MLPDLDNLLKYKNVDITARYQHDFPNSTLPADEALQELLKYIWLYFKHQADITSDPSNQRLDFSCVIHKEMNDIDNMWHTFLIFTQDYHAFCQQYLNGIFFHHVPFTKDGDKPSEAEYARELSCYLSYIHDNLGEETLRKWFQI